MAAQYLLALDAGSGSGRSVLVSVDGRDCHVASRDWEYEYEPEHGPMACHFDPERFWNVLAGTVREVLAKAGVEASQIMAVSTTSQREGCVLLDRRGCELYAGPNRDDRAHAIGDELARSHGDEIYGRTGHFPTGMFAAARLQWFRRNQPDLYDRAATLLMINDWVVFRLCNVLATEPTNASETCLFDLAGGRWADDLMEDLELRRDLFAEVVAPGTRRGEVTRAASEDTGLIAGTPVVVGGADTQCGVLGSGASACGDLAIVAGTTSPLQMILSEPVVDRAGRLWSGRYLSPNTFVLESNAGLAGTVYRWCLETIAPRRGYQTLNDLAGSAPPGASGARSFAGVILMNARAPFRPLSTLELGQTMWRGDTRPNVARAVLESLAFAARANAEQIASTSPVPIEEVTACGGLTRSALYVSMLAACLERTIRVSRWPESTGVGAAICAGIGIGLFNAPAEGQRALAGEGRVVEPDPHLVEAYRSLYPAWLETYRGLAERFE